MEFKLKTKSWARNISHQFESFCQDVDELVNKDSMKSVSSQVQNVGISVKKLCSNVVQDILPLTGDIVKPKQQSETAEKADMEDHISVTGIRISSTCTNGKQLQMNKVSNDHEIQISNPASNRESQACQYSGDSVNAIFQNTEDSPGKNTATKDLNPMTANSSFDSDIFSRELVIDYISSSPVFLANKEVSTSIEKERRDFYHQKLDNGFTDHTVCLSETSSTGWLSQSTTSVLEELCSEENQSLSLTAVPVSTHKINQDNCSMMDFPLSPACDADDWLLGKDRALCESCYTEHENADLSISDQLSKHTLCNKKEQIASVPSTCCTSPKSPISMESSSADFSKKAENVLHSHSISDGCPYQISAASSINAADTTEEAASSDLSKKDGNVLHCRSESDCCFSAASSVTFADTTKALDVDPFFPILESNDNNALQTSRSKYSIGSSESRHEEHYKEVHSKIAISPSQTENTHVLGVPIDDLDLESIDLFHDSKHDRKSVVMNSNFVLAGSYRRRNFQYYKNLIKGTFTSQKRLSKEYEHLGIMYEDIDAKSNLHFEPNSLPSFPNTNLQVPGTQSSQDIDQWELL